VADGTSGEYRDPVDWGQVAGGALVGGFFLAIVGPLAFQARNLFLTVFLLFMPFVGLLVVLRGFNVVTLGFDRNGWRYRRQIFGLTLETEAGGWQDIARSDYRQWATQGRYGAVTLYGELSLWDVPGKAVLRARTIFYNRSNPGAGHAPGRRQIGLSEGDFPYFVQMIDRETPQLDYEWVPSPAPEEPPHRGFLVAKPGPDRYMRLPRGSAPVTAQPGGEDEQELAQEGFHRPTPF
jgi:hypothetical protein